MDYLYHYTSIEALALILKNKTIRFTSLDQVDDMEEGLALDVNDYGQFIFVSCWTNTAEESIPQWNMYAKDMGGVRIALPKYPFTHYSFLDNPARAESLPFPGCSIIKDVHIDEGIVLPWGESYLINVTYLQPEDKRTPTIMDEISEYGKRMNVGILGTVKDICWSFQNEARYRIILAPHKILKIDNTGKYPIELGMTRKFIDVPIREDAFESMQITLGPKHTEANKVILNALLDAFNPKVNRDVVSSLRIRT